MHFLPDLLVLDNLCFFDSRLQLVNFFYDKNTFFLSFSFMLVLDKISFNVLKNIFLKYVPDLYFWAIISNLFSSSWIYFKTGFPSLRHFEKVRFFEYLIFDIYFKEIDKYLIYLFKDISFIKSLCFLKNINLFKFVIPIRVKSLSNLFFYIHYLRLKSFFKRGVYLSSRSGCFKRLNNSFLLVLVSSKRFVQVILKNIKSFMQGNLHICIFFFSLVYINRIFYFMDYKILCMVILKKDYLDSKKNFKAFFILSINKKLKLFNNINFKFSLHRLYSELISHVNALVLKTEITKIFLRDRQIWNYILQLESKRCFQFNKLINNLDFLDLINDSIKRPFFYFNYKQSIFFLKSYIVRIQSVYKRVTDKILTSYLYNPIKNFDFYLKLFMIQFAKNLTHYNSLVQFDLNSVSRVNIDRDVFKQKFCLLYCPILLVVKKLRVLGFLHPVKNKPIANILYVVLEDLSIIESYICIRYMYNSWYKFCDNYFTVAKLVDLLFLSCVVSISRKHKKNHGFI